MAYQKKKCWSILLRLYHWAFALSIVTLVITGFYINDPWFTSLKEGSASFPMAYMRFVHFVAGYVFTAAVLTRIFLYLFGNKQERILEHLPVTPRNVKSFFNTVLRYSYIKDDHDTDRLGHNVAAGLTYVITIVLAVFQLISGFYMLFPELALYNGWLWEGLGVTIFGSQQMARYVHHLVMWWFLYFILVHIYLVIWNDLKHPEGLISSMFTGVKFIKKG
ncbi:MAG: Ni/Fe-hydrogenase, b-type cytochrome subunit [Desulfofustis sp.]|jgi:Ni/Fe-hydrogenase 1 B-type cytochrome subunit|nr:Ni/Fe-hydrogenase, b-type cytochrome subunit [Desulfofustis sp.]